MPRRTFVDFDALAVLLRQSERVLRHSELIDLGVPKSTIMSRIGPDGPWQRLLPGVIAAHRGIPTRRERLLAAQRYAGESSVVTGIPALVEYGVSAARRAGTRPHMLVPHECRRTSHGFVVIERTRRLPDPVQHKGLRLASVARAVIDACRREENLDQVREIVAEVIQDRRCTVADLVAEVRRAARQRTALTRVVLREIEAGIRSVAEAKVRAALIARGVDWLDWNADLLTTDGEFVACPDAYCRRSGVALQVDSMQWHLRPKRYRRTQKVQRGLTYWGVFVLPWSPADAIENPTRSRWDSSSSSRWVSIVRCRPSSYADPPPDGLTRTRHWGAVLRTPFVGGVPCDEPTGAGDPRDVWKAGGWAVARRSPGTTARDPRRTPVMPG